MQCTKLNMNINNFFKLLALCFLAVMCVQCSPVRIAQEVLMDAQRVDPSKDAYRVGFYNVENLFDTIDSPLRKDDDFTPQGRNKWTKVENSRVCQDLARQEALKDAGYITIHQQSPDFRGIDVALMYKKDDFRT